MTANKGGRKYAMQSKKDKDIYLQAITMIDINVKMFEDNHS